MPPRFRPNYFCRYIPGTLSTVLCNHCTYCTFFFSFFFLRFIFISPFCRSPCSPSPSLFFFRSFCPFVLSFSVCFLYRLLRFYFRIPAFLGGGFCYSVISSRRYTPPALLASLKYACFPLAYCLLAFLMLTYLYFCFSSFPFSISIWTAFVSSCLFLVGTMLSPRFRFLLRLV